MKIKFERSEGFECKYYHILPCLRLGILGMMYDYKYAVRLAFLAWELKIDFIKQ